ncbi:DoxX family protein [Amylibacter sp. SFDW26]|uniref:DoxX family protein n=1 Tax=Amylibacter sp. SFDW26 TaxID=2652722 RepID=UPI0012623928|nr:DoxX family protein [Amylibacter sp. SFDW26]KAB7615793.1 DoxX family protein [Amylibacter sp. SFDW26]
MNAIFTLYNKVIDMITKLAGTWLLPTLARFAFAAVLLVYFWNSAKTKVGDGVLGFLFPNDNAYIQMFPKVFDAVGYDSSALGGIYKLIAIAGTTAEFVLPFLILVGLFTRFAAIGMIGFVFVQSFVDKTGHDLDSATFGSWFDRASDSLVLDQRLLWITLLITMIVKGAGPLSLDRVLKIR